MKFVGLVLIVIGIVGLAYGGISWTQRDQVMDVGPVHVTHDKTKSLPLPPIAGGLALAAGVAVLVSARRT
ncbi:MAG TPA: hypothetical protein VIX35_03795 [Vicinamibacterales bacterium]